MKQRLTVFFLFCSFIALSASGQGKESHFKTAKELLTVLNTEASLRHGVDMALASQLRASPHLKPYEDILKKFLSKYMSWSYLQQKYIAMYMEEFTETELRAMIAFYKTDIGKKVVLTLPIITAKGTELGQKAIEEHLPELTVAIEERAGRI